MLYITYVDIDTERLVVRCWLSGVKSIYICLKRSLILI